ncbi:Na+/H+ antiporter NhaA [Novosphingobium sp.]|uniref:Na+/H+ antiporter NhaA n=1 Tax=Novosphingobium sp. TaxID=1874826 RepID=UPI0025DF7332|nr:Na+/H+ antiporter NhaA [Novosphingobium sp.]MCC6924994.1 Na+/H+ antiporter NhaA [Novosphingobium sp.]
MTAKRHPFSILAGRIARLLHGDAGAGILLLAVAAAAMLLANSPLGPAYHEILHHPLGSSPVAHLGTLHAWINDGLMALFFFVVGLEIKREVLEGQLARPEQRRLPVLAAIAGMALPAAIYLLVSGGEPRLQAGWAIPAATDIAFAVGILGLLGKGLPPSLRLFLLTVAIVDDLGAVAIIALVYTAQLDLTWLALSGVVLAGLALANRRGIKRGWVYALGGTLLWYAVLHSGIHATIAGVLAALCVPIALDRQGESLLLRMEHVLAPLSAYLIVPVFGLANAGVALPRGGIAAIDPTLPMAVALGLVLGKLGGIFGAVYLAEKSGFAPRPAGTSWRQVLGLSALCGIGFTMSLFIAQLAFPAAPELVEDAKLGVFAGSLLAALLGFVLLRRSARG